MIKWDQTGKRLYETGIDRGVLYDVNDSGKYVKGVPWNGLISVTESPTGAEKTPLYANNKKYGELVSAEEWEGNITAYTYPDEFAKHDGSAEMTTGMTVHQQKRTPFGLCYRSQIGNDVKGTDYAYELHIVYGATASPSERSHSTINDSPEAAELSWDITTTPVEIEGMNPSATVSLDSRKLPEKALQAVEKILYGSEEAEARLPLPDELKKIIDEEVGK